GSPGRARGVGPDGFPVVAIRGIRGLHAGARALSRIVVVTTTFPQWEGDPRGAFIRRHWELRCERGDEVVVLAPRTRWCTDDLASPLVVKRIAYAPARLSTLTGRFGILENIRERPWRACLVPLLWRALRRSLVAELEAEGADLVVGHMMLPA